jgi:hypothetical protein
MYIIIIEKRGLVMDKKKLLTKIVAAIALALMVFSVCGTLLYYLFAV